jgi:hypothetical protein
MTALRLARATFSSSSESSIRPTRSPSPSIHALVPQQLNAGNNGSRYKPGTPSLAGGSAEPPEADWEQYNFPVRMVPNRAARARS